MLELYIKVISQLKIMKRQILVSRKDRLWQNLELVYSLWKLKSVGTEMFRLMKGRVRSDCPVNLKLKFIFSVSARIMIKREVMCLQQVRNYSLNISFDIFEKFVFLTCHAQCYQISIQNKSTKTTEHIV